MSKWCAPYRWNVASSPTERWFPQRFLDGESLVFKDRIVAQAWADRLNGRNGDAYHVAYPVPFTGAG